MLTDYLHRFFRTVIQTKLVASLSNFVNSLYDQLSPRLVGLPLKEVSDSFLFLQVRFSLNYSSAVCLGQRYLVILFLLLASVFVATYRYILPR